MEGLKSAVESILALLQTFDTSLSTLTDDRTTADFDALSVLSDGAKLLRAQTTKLSLLAINEPFSPEEITHILENTSLTCLPAMVGAVELCRPRKYSQIMQKEMNIRLRHTFREMMSLVRKIPTGEANGTKTANMSKDILAITGIIWESCDALIELKEDGIVGLVVKKAEQYRDLVKDGINELEEWGKINDDDTSDGEDDEYRDEDEFDFGDSIDKDDVELQKQLQDSLKLLRAVGLLYPAIIKRRLKRFPTPSKEYTKKLELVMDMLAKIPNSIDEAACSFYDSQREEAQRCIEECRQTALSTIVLTQPAWEGGDDEFTAWSKQLYAHLETLQMRK